MSRLPLLPTLALLALACTPKSPSRKEDPRPPAPSAARSAVDAAPTRPDIVTLSIVGTTDVHGHTEGLAVLGGHLANLRRARAADGGAVLLVDSGDMFQGTLESNSGEGEVMVRAYNALGYVAAAVGNHEFDFGPAGSDLARPGDDLRGALKARAAEARFAFLCANLIDAATGAQVAWPNMPASVIVEAAGVRVGLVGVTSEGTPGITGFFRGLEVAPLAPTVATEAAGLRARGAQVVVALVHAGGACARHDDPTDLSSCDDGAELFRLARALPAGSVDAIFGGHTHQTVAHVVNGIAIAQAQAIGAGLARVDLSFDRRAGRVVGTRVHPPRLLCGGAPGAAAAGEEPACAPAPYEGAPVTPDPAVASIHAGARAEARLRREASLGVTLDAPLARGYAEESPLGNLLADLMREARPGHDAAIINAGAVRADLPAGELTYGKVYQVHPFDNRFAVLRLRGADLERVIAANLEAERGILLVSGIRATAACRRGVLEVTLRREDGRPIRDGERLDVLASDFLATGGDRVLAGIDLPADAIRLDEGSEIREAIVEVIRSRRGPLVTPRLRERRVAYPGRRPVRCAAP